MLYMGTILWPLLESYMGACPCGLPEVLTVAHVGCVPSFANHS